MTSGWRPTPAGDAQGRWVRCGMDKSAATTPSRINARVVADSKITADEARSRNDLHAGPTRRIDHGSA